MSRSVLVALSVWLALGCGSSPSPAPAPPPQPAPEPGGNPTTAPPSPPPATPPPAPETFVTVERLDSDPECDELVPTSIPVPVKVHIADQTPFCGRGISEGHGNVALSHETQDVVEWTLFSPSGTAGRVLTQLGRSLLPQPDGWQAVQLQLPNGSPPSVNFVTYSGDGSPRRSEPFPPGERVGIAGDPLGGSLLVVSGDPASPPCGEARRYAADGTLRGTSQVECDTAAAGVSNLGEALVLGHDGGHVILHWLRADGSPASAPSDDGDSKALFGSRGVLALVPLLDGSLAAWSGFDWMRRYPHLAASGEAVPAWLAAQIGQSFRFTRGNRGYAFFPVLQEASADCTQAVKLLARSGRLCVRVTFREDAKDCTTRTIDQGWDGTVVQQSGKDGCDYRWWPRLLAGP